MKKSKLDLTILIHKSLLVLMVLFWALSSYAQNVGIGTNKPITKLEIKDTLKVSVKISSKNYEDTSQLIFSNRYRDISNGYLGTDMIISANKEEGLKFSSQSDLSLQTNDNILQISPQGNIGIGNISSTSKFSIGKFSQFQIDSLGNIKKLNSVPISFPNYQGSENQVLLNKGNGTLKWSDIFPTGAKISSEKINPLFDSLGFRLAFRNPEILQPYVGSENGSWWDTTVYPNFHSLDPYYKSKSNVLWSKDLNRFIVYDSGSVHSLDPIDIDNWGSLSLPVGIVGAIPIESQFRYTPMIANINNSVFVLGGSVRYVAAKLSLQENLKYNLIAHAWSAMATMPIGLSDGYVCNSDSNIFIFGGLTDTGYGFIQNYNKLLVYNIFNNSWTTKIIRLPHYQTSVGNGPCFFFNNSIYFYAQYDFNAWGLYKLNLGTSEISNLGSYGGDACSFGLDSMNHLWQTGNDYLNGNHWFFQEIKNISIFDSVTYHVPSSQTVNITNGACAWFNGSYYIYQDQILLRYTPNSGLTIPIWGRIKNSDNYIYIKK